MKMVAPESRGPPRPSADLQAGSGRLRDDRAEDPGNRPDLCPILARHWFGHRCGRAIDQGDFVDRLPHQRPLCIDEIGARS